MRIVGHLDLDAFFAAIEERDNLSLCGLTIMVGADPGSGKGRGVVVTANYKAYEYGIHSALPITTASRLSEAAKKQGKPSVTFLAARMKSWSSLVSTFRPRSSNKSAWGRPSSQHNLA